MAKVPVVSAYWSQLIEGLQASPLQFYDHVEQAIEARQVPDSKRTRVDWREGGLLSAKREYLRVTRKKLVFDICGAPYGTGFFVSYWGGRLVGLLESLREMPWMGEFLGVVKPITYYKHDTEVMFYTSVHQAVREVVDEMIKGQGLRCLTEGEWKPELKSFFDA